MNSLKSKFNYLLNRCFQSTPRRYEYFNNRSPWYNNQNIWRITGAAGLMGLSYYLYHLETVPISGRRRFMDLSKESEEMISKWQYNQFMSENKNRILPSNHPSSVMVRKVAEKIIQVCGINGLNWEIHVINGPEKNAFVMPGGKIFVFTGILPIVKDENGLASVLGHEIAHQLARHSAEKLSWTRLFLVANVVLSLFMDTSLIFNRLFLEMGIFRPFSRKCELEADYVGLQLMAKACYDPNAAVDMWCRMKSSDGGHPPEYMSTHPSHDTRIKKIKEWIPEATQVRESSDCMHTFSLLDAFGSINYKIFNN